MSNPDVAAPSAEAAVGGRGSSVVRLRERPNEGWAHLREWWPGLGAVTGRGCRIAAHPDGSLTFVSSETGRVTRLDGAGAVLGAVSGTEARLVRPQAVAAGDPDGAACWAADPVGGRLVRLGADLGVTRTMALLPGCFGPHGTETPGAPAAVAVRDGLLLVADSRHAVGGLARFTEDGDWLGAVALSLSGRCAVPQPTVVALSGERTAWAISGLNGRLYRIEGDEAMLVGGLLARPNFAATGIAVDEDGRVHVAVAEFNFRGRHRIVHLDGAGQVLGVTHLVPRFHPTAIAAAAGLLWVSGPGGDLFGFALPGAAAVRAA
jgi:hypothetical protein